MSGFNSKCLVKISNIQDMEHIKELLCNSNREQAIKEVTDECICFVTPNLEDGDNGLPGYYAQCNEYGEEDSAIFGIEEPEKLIAFAKNMEKEAKKQADWLISAANLTEESTISDMLIAASKDSLNSYYLRHAMEILDRRVNTDCWCMIFDGLWYPWPHEKTLKKITKNPSDWAVIELLFK